MLIFLLICSPLVMTDRIERQLKTKEDIVNNIDKLGEGIEVFMCYAPDPDDPCSDPEDNQAVVLQHETKIWDLMHDFERHGFLVSSDLNMPLDTSNILRWIASRIDNSDFVIIVCSPALKELVSCLKLPEGVKDKRAERLFRFSNAIYEVLQRKTTATTKVVTVILDDHYQDDVVPTFFAGGHIYRLHKVASPREFDYDRNGPFEQLICRMANIDRSQPPQRQEVQRLPPPHQGGEWLSFFAHRNYVYVHVLYMCTCTCSLIIGYRCPW